MPDREKVIKELMKLHGTKETMAVIFDAISLLKEQEAVKPIYNKEKYEDHLPHCGNCEKVLPNRALYGKVNFCHYCGKMVKWE